MGFDLIYKWLDLPAGPWPPDHRTLLGLSPEERDPACIERQVQERLERVRHFQLAHPEQATEAMNRLAQAFISLTEANQQQEPTAAAVETAAQQLDWQETPPPLRSKALAETPAASSTPTLTDAATAETPPVPASARPLFDPDALWRPLRTTLTTRGALLERITLVRQLLQGWRAIGKYLRRSERPLSKPSEATDLIQQMDRVRKLLGTLPGLLGEAGLPGYLVAALARQPLIVPTVQTLLPSQRSALARDWHHGLALLVAHQRWLRLELRARRSRSGFARGVRAILLTLYDRPGLVLIALGLVALNLIPAARARLFEQCVLLLAVLAFRFFHWWDARKTVQNVSTPPLPHPRGRTERRLAR